MASPGDPSTAGQGQQPATHRQQRQRGGNKVAAEFTLAGAKVEWPQHTVPSHWREISTPKRPDEFVR
jgi:hypothetical protein